MKLYIQGRPTGDKISCIRPRRGELMATNTGKGYRKGAVKDRSQMEIDATDGKYVKRDDKTGRFMDIKEGDKPFKGIAKEPDGRKK